MNWQAVTFDWNQIRAFLATVEEGSLSAAARALGLTQPTLGRQIAALEAHLGLTLFDRTGRALALTDAGLELADHVRAMGEAATRLSLAATGQAQSVEGLVRVTASEMYAGHLLPPVVTRLRALHPGIRIEILAENTLSDLRRREADIAVRNARPTDPDLIARHLRDDEAALFAAPDYLARFPGASSPRDFPGAEFIGFADNAQWIEALNGLGFGVGARSMPVASASHMVHWALTCAGAGIGVAPVSVGDADPRVRRVLPELAPFAVPIWLVAAREVRTSRRIRIVWDALAEALGAGVASVSRTDAIPT